MILFFGLIGAGKSVQGQILSARHGWRWLSTGQMLRDTHDPELLKQMTTGELVSETFMRKAVSEALHRSKDMKGVILDGFPRTLGQAEWLLGSQAEHGRSVQLAIILEVPRSEIMQRLHVRGRADDEPEAIEKRMTLYRQEIYPILTYLANNHVRIVHIDGTGSVGQVHDRIEAELQACSLV